MGASIGASMIKQLIIMNGFGMYVWPAFMITLLVLSINILSPLREKKSVRKAIFQYTKQKKLYESQTKK